jgi:hypothetical protein
MPCFFHLTTKVKQKDELGSCPPSVFLAKFRGEFTFDRAFTTVAHMRGEMLSPSVLTVGPRGLGWGLDDIISVCTTPVHTVRARLAFWRAERPAGR